MQRWQHDGSSYEEIVAKHGPWSAMSIALPGGQFTREQAPDRRLHRLLQVAADLSHKPINQCRVLDLACLEGHYGIEFAMHGAEVVCVEIRDANLAKAAYAIDALGLNNCTLVQDDVRNLSLEKYGSFDIIICSGILYHLQAKDVAGLIASMGNCCTGLCIIDTYFAAREKDEIIVDGVPYRGFIYREHNDAATAAQKADDLWASIDNESSFWFAQRDVVTLLHSAGFTSCFDALLPTHPELTYDRRMVAAVKGAATSVLTSPMTKALAYERAAQSDPNNLHPYQSDKSLAFRVGKQFLPQPIKDAIKPVLRKIGILKTQDVRFPIKS